MVTRRELKEIGSEGVLQRRHFQQYLKRQRYLGEQNRWQAFREERKRVFEGYIDAKATQRKSEALVAIIKCGVWIRHFAQWFEEEKLRRVRSENMKFCIFRAKFQWRQRKARKRAVLKVFERTIDYGEFKYREYSYIDNWDEIYQNYARRA